VQWSDTRSGDSKLKERGNLTLDSVGNIYVDDICNAIIVSKSLTSMEILFQNGALAA
jgi:hypothetical protein